MTTEGLELKYQPITPIKQSYEASCVPTAVSMVFSGFGVEISEQELIDRYFPTARLQMLEEGAGVSKSNIILGIHQSLEDMNLQEILQVDVFSPWLWKYTDSSEARYIVPSKPSAARKFGEDFKEDDSASKDSKDFYYTLGKLAEKRKIGIYSVNGSRIEADHRGYSLDLKITEVRNELNHELVDFVRKGHVIGFRGSLGHHVYAVDGTKTSEQGYWLVDPRGTSELADSRHVEIVRVDSSGIRGDLFNFMVRLSLKEEELNTQQYGSPSLFQHLRDLIP